MFCIQCGAEVAESMVFCPKCGAKLAREGNRQNAQGIVKPESPESNNKEKKKPAVKYIVVALLIVIGVFVLLFVVLKIGSDSGRYGSADIFDSEFDTDNYDRNRSEGVSLTQTYLNEDEGFSFMYPDGWEIENVEETDPNWLISVAHTGALGTYARIAITKEVDDGSLFAIGRVDFEEEYSSAEDINDFKMMDLSDIALDGYPARKLTCAYNNDIGFRVITIQYFYVRDSYTYVVTCAVEKDNYDRYEPIFNDIMDSYNIYTENATDSSLPEWGKSSVDAAYYGDVLLSELLDKSKDEVGNILGVPASGTPITGELLFGGTEYYGYDGLTLYFDCQTNTVDSISVLPALVKINGVTLNKNRAELTGLLGEPDYEDYYYDESGEFDNFYYLRYAMYDAGIIFDLEMPDADGMADFVNIYRYKDDSDDGWDGDDDDPLGYEWYGDNEGASDLGYGLSWIEMPYTSTDKVSSRFAPRQGIENLVFTSKTNNPFHNTNIRESIGYLVDKINRQYPDVGCYWPDSKLVFLMRQPET